MGKQIRYITRRHFNLISDISEQDNLIAQYPERAARLKKAGEIFELKIKAEARPIGIDQ